MNTSYSDRCAFRRCAACVIRVRRRENARDDGGLDRGAGDAVLSCALTAPACTHGNVRAEVCAKTERAESRGNRRAIKRETGVEDS